MFFDKVLENSDRKKMVISAKYDFFYLVVFYWSWSRFFADPDPDKRTRIRNTPYDLTKDEERSEQVWGGIYTRNVSDNTVVIYPYRSF